MFRGMALDRQASIPDYDRPTRLAQVRAAVAKTCVDPRFQKAVVDLYEIGGFRVLLAVREVIGSRPGYLAVHINAVARSRGKPWREVLPAALRQEPWDRIFTHSATMTTIRFMLAEEQVATEEGGVVTIDVSFVTALLAALSIP